MPNVPKIVHERLKVATPAPVHHPDPDVLTAFSERSLPERERATVLDHLSRCGDCREVVALALPASEILEPVNRKSYSNRVAWPTFRWAFVSFGLAAFAVLGVLQYQKHSRATLAYQRSSAPTTEARNESPSAPAAQDQVTAPKQQVAQFVAADRDKAKAAEPKINRETSAPSPTADLAKPVGRPAFSQTLPHGPRQMTQWQQLNNNVAQMRAPSPPMSRRDDEPQPATAANSKAQVAASSETVQVQLQSHDAELDGPSASGSALILNSQPLPQQSPQSGSAETEVSRAKSALNGAPPKALPPAESPQMQARSFNARVANGPNWTITSGQLQRSFDQGITWQNVNVTAPPGAASNTEVTALSGAKSSQATPKDSLKAYKKEQPSSPTFRTVAANGPDVWAGAGGGLLYHSSDAGTHWTQVTPASAGATLTGDIVSLEFPDPQNGKVSTSTAEVWITDNGGRTWQKQ